MFCGFLEDTIEVEHHLVIPAVAVLRELPYKIPDQPLQDLFATATDEGFHAEQSLMFTSALRKHFDLETAKSSKVSLFLKRLREQRSSEPSPLYKKLITVMNGVITETRISLELGDFARNTELVESVREVCRTHAEDEAIHASQFKALGTWLWSQFDEETRKAAAQFIVASTIARSLPDIERIAHCFAQATRCPPTEAQLIVFSAYTANRSIDELLFAARPTLNFIRKLGVEEYLSISDAFEDERNRLARELEERRRNLASKLPEIELKRIQARVAGSSDL